MKLHEEFKLFETMWDDDFEEEDPNNLALFNTGSRITYSKDGTTMIVPENDRTFTISTEAEAIEYVETVWSKYIGWRTEGEPTPEDGKLNAAYKLYIYAADSEGRASPELIKELHKVLKKYRDLYSNSKKNN
jgi:hypothetical protein